MAAPDLATILAALSRPEAFAHPAPAPAVEVEVVHTHASAVILAGEHACKLKKPVDLGFLDCSTREKRRALLGREAPARRGGGWGARALGGWCAGLAAAIMSRS